MKVAYKIFVPLLEIAIFPVLFFLPLLHMNITSSLAGSLSQNLGIPEYSSLFYWVRTAGNMEETQSTLWKGIFEAIKDKNGTIGSMFTNRVWVYVFLSFAAAMLVLAIVTAVLAIATKRYGLTSIFSILTIGCAVGMNKSFDAFAKPFLTGQISITSLLGSADSDLSTGLLGNLLGSLAKVESMELAVAYSLAFFLLVIAAAACIITYIMQKNA